MATGVPREEQLAPERMLIEHGVFEGQGPLGPSEELRLPHEHIEHPKAELTLTVPGKYDKEYVGVFTLVVFAMDSSGI